MMLAEADGVIEEASPADDVESDEGDAAREVTNDMIPPGDDNMRELTVYNKTTSDTSEASVLCVVTVETTSKRFDYSLPFSSAVADLYIAIANEAGGLQTLYKYMCKMSSFKFSSWQYPSNKDSTDI